MSQERIRIEQARPQGLLRRLLRLRQRYDERPMWAEVAHYDGEQDFDTPVVIVSEAEARDAGLRIGDAVVLEDDIRRGGVGATPSCGYICLVKISWRKPRETQLIVYCQWWRRKTVENGRRVKLWRQPRPEMAPAQTPEEAGE